MTLDAAGPREKRWFNVMLGFSAGAAVAFVGMTAMHYWAKGKLQAIDKADGGQVQAGHELLQNVQLATLVGQGILMVACVGFFIAGGNWLLAMKKRKAGGLR
jgi:hypothetical protein